MGQAASADAVLGASLENVKRANSAFLDNQNPQTARDFTTAMDCHGTALEDAGMPQQARDIKRAKKHFQRNKKRGSRSKFAFDMAGTLMDLTVKELHRWSMREVLDRLRDDEGGDADERGLGDEEEDFPDDPDDGNEEEGDEDDGGEEEGDEEEGDEEEGDEEGGGWWIFDMLSGIFGGEEEE